MRKSRWNLTLPIKEARRNEEVIALADSQMLRWINEINGNANMDDKAFNIRNKIKRIKKEPNSLQNKKRIRELYNELDKLQFMPDYMCLVIDRNSDYWRACKGFRINGIKYARLLGTAGGIKNKTIIFVNADIHDELEKRIENGRNKDIPFVTAKLEAYRALTCSASTPVSWPHGILVVPDCETHFKDDIIYITDEGNGEPLMEERKDQDITINASDGCGMMLPSLAKRWSRELGLDYMIAGANTRCSFEKGMIFTFDFLDFADKVAGGKYIVKDAWGDERDIRDIELIFTTSMLKLWDSYGSCEEYLDKCMENHYTMAVTKTCPKELENERSLNYQFIQSYDLDENDIEELIQPTISEVKEILGGDWRKAVLFLCGSGLTEDNVNRNKNDVAKAIMADRRMVNDPYIRSTIYSAIKNRINEAKIGVLKVHGNYSIASGDIYALCQSVFGLEITGLLKRGEIYNRYWADLGTEKLVCFRAPMSTHENVREVHPANREDVNYWFRYMNTCTIFNAWDTAMNALNGMDYDADIVMLTDNPVLVNKHEKLPTLMCIQRKAEKRISREEDFVRSNIASFGDNIGKTTNWITSMFDMRACFKKTDKEYKVLSYRIKCGQLYQQNAIDKTKGIICKPMPKEWYDRHSVNKMEDDNKKELYRKIVVDKKPYFMKYIYPDLMKRYNTYIKNTNRNALRSFQLTVDEILHADVDNSKEDQINFATYYKRKLPVGNHCCVMNQICKRIENEFDSSINRYGNNEPFDYTIMKSDAVYTATMYYSVMKLYNEYTRKQKDFAILLNSERVSSEESLAISMRMNEEFKESCYKVCPNRYSLCNIILDLCYRRNSTKKFAWSMCSQEIIHNLLKNNGCTMSFPTADNTGDISYCGDRYKEVQVKVEVDE